MSKYKTIYQRTFLKIFIGLFRSRNTDPDADPATQLNMDPPESGA
jgi:hypothetical protein